MSWIENGFVRAFFFINKNVFVRSFLSAERVWYVVFYWLYVVYYWLLVSGRVSDLMRLARRKNMNAISRVTESCHDRNDGNHCRVAAIFTREKCRILNAALSLSRRCKIYQ